MSVDIKPLPAAMEPEPYRSQHVAELAHATPGRVRLRLPAAKRNPNLLNQVRTAFENHPGIDAVSISSPASASLVIYYDTDHHPDVASFLRSLGQGDTGCSLQTAVKLAEPPRHTENPPANRAPHLGARTKLDEEIGQIEEEAEFLAEHSALARSIVQGVKALDQKIKRGTNNTIDLKILAPVGLAGFTFLEIGALAATPMWVTLVIFSLNHFVELRAHGPADSPKTAKMSGKDN